MSQQSDKLDQLNKLWRIVMGIAVACILAGAILFLLSPEESGIAAGRFAMASILLASVALFVIQPRINKLKGGS